MNDAPLKPIPVVMIIDDEAFDQKMYRRIIDRSGLVQKTLSFTAADHALDYLKTNTDQEIDLILLDINMPRMNGFEFLDAAISELGPQFAKACIVMLTTSLDPTDRERAAQYEIVRDLLNKPLTYDDLVRLSKLIANVDAAPFKPPPPHQDGPTRQSPLR